MREAGFTIDFCANREMEMRNSNQLMVLANYFGVSPAYLCGWRGHQRSARGHTAAEGA